MKIKPAIVMSMVTLIHIPFHVMRNYKLQFSAIRVPLLIMCSLLSLSSSNLYSQNQSFLRNEMQHLDSVLQHSEHYELKDYRSLAFASLMTSLFDLRLVDDSTASYMLDEIVVCKEEYEKLKQDFSLRENYYNDVVDSAKNELFVRHSSWDDDRLVANPYQDTVLELTSHASIQRLEERRQQLPDTIFVTYVFSTEHGKERVIVMSSLYEPMIFHDKNVEILAHFVGYFKRRNRFYFFYESHESEARPKSMDKLMKDWRLRDEMENPEFFPKNILYYNLDPYVYEFELDSLANCRFIESKWR